VRDGAPEGRGGGLVAAGHGVQPAGREQRGLEAAAQLVPAGLRPFARGQPGQEIAAVSRDGPLQIAQGCLPSRAFRAAARASSNVATSQSYSREVVNE
jgi:hypothetical protein